MYSKLNKHVLIRRFGSLYLVQRCLILRRENSGKSQGKETDIQASLAFTDFSVGQCVLVKPVESISA